MDEDRGDVSLETAGDWAVLDRKGRGMLEESLDSEVLRCCSSEALRLVIGGDSFAGSEC